MLYHELYETTRCRYIVFIVGGSASGIPGNVKGMHHVWKKHGKLTWSELVEPTIDLVENGYEISKIVGDQIGWHKDTKLQYDAGFRYDKNCFVRLSQNILTRYLFRYCT